MKTRTTISVDSSLYELAQRMMARERFSNFSYYVEHLIRDQWKQRFPNEPLPPVDSPKAAPTESEVLALCRKARKASGINTAPFVMNEQPSSAVTQATKAIVQAVKADVVEQMGSAAFASPAAPTVPIAPRPVKAPRARGRKGPA